MFTISEGGEMTNKRRPLTEAGRKAWAAYMQKRKGEYHNAQRSGLDAETLCPESDPRFRERDELLDEEQRFEDEFLRRMGVADD